ncbi:MAG: ribosomal protein S18-alanine N-acetyltransferase [Clostridia bacterium]|jgi:ribosomal-protein-alanine N-acetyltransferase|nr:ribosomal protein S18-alanine N-acetyltransferase [Clostridia bacterium]
MITIEKMSREHLSEVASIEEMSFSLPWSLESLELMLTEQASALVALEDGRVLGYVGMMCVLDEGQIINVAVHPDARRRGVGRTLMEAAQTYAKERGIVFLSLEVRESNIAARSLYSSLGWEEQGIRKGFYSHPVENACVMTKSI